VHSWQIDFPTYEIMLYAMQLRLFDIRLIKPYYLPIQNLLKIKGYKSINIRFSNNIAQKPAI